jgi:hypothetical protein
LNNADTSGFFPMRDKGIPKWKENLGARQMMKFE